MWSLICKAIKGKLLMTAALAVITVLICVAVYINIEVKVTSKEVGDKYLSLVDRTRVGNGRNRFFEDFYDVYFTYSDITDEDNPNGILGSGGGGGKPKNPPLVNNPTWPPDEVQYSDSEINRFINSGLFTREDLNALLCCYKESTNYIGFYAVCCCIRNRVNKSSSTYLIQASAPNAFAYEAGQEGKANQSQKNAAVAVLIGGPSTVGDARYFFSPCNYYHLWMEGKNKYSFVNWGGNVFYDDYGKLHNMVSNSKVTTNDTMIAEAKDGGASKGHTWYYNNGEGYIP